jgi:hypothetical protein
MDRSFVLFDDRISNPDRSFVPQLSSVASRLGWTDEGKADQPTHAACHRRSTGDAPIPAGQTG